MQLHSIYKHIIIFTFIIDISLPNGHSLVCGQLLVGLPYIFLLTIYTNFCSHNMLPFHVKISYILYGEVLQYNSKA